MSRETAGALALAIIAASIVALCVSIGTAFAAPDIGDVKDGFTIAAMVAGQIFTAGAVYGAIRGDIKHLHERTTAAIEAARQAHERIDELYQSGRETRRR